MKASIGVVLALVVLVAIVLGPIATIGSINVLFGTSIAMTFKVWLSVAWLSFAVGAALRGKK